MEKQTLPFGEWLTELVRVTMENTGLDVVRINAMSAKEWWADGFTPYECFRETFSNENDTE